MSRPGAVSEVEVRVGDRVLAAYVAGAEAGPAIVVHHGTPACGELYAEWARDAAARGARLIGFDRPGYGRSGRHPDRRIVDVVDEVRAVTEALGIERFVTWGVSGGGPHALACAAALPERVSAVATLGGVAPFDAPGLNYLLGMGQDNHVEFGLALAGREHLEPLAEGWAQELREGSAQSMIESMSTLLADVDRDALHGPLGTFIAGAYPRALAHGAGGWVDDDLAFIAPWGFALDEVSCPALIVHGAHDRFVPIAHGEWLANALPSAETWLLGDEGHLSLLAMLGRVHEWLLARG